VGRGFSEGLAQDLKLPATVASLSSPQNGLSRLRRWLGSAPVSPAQKP